MEDKNFVDTNILVYCFDDSEPIKKNISKKLIETLWESHNGVISLQVLKEFFVTVTQKLENRIDMEDAKNIIWDLFSWEVFFENRTSFEKAIQILERYRVSFWDSNIISSAILSNCKKLYSEDLHPSLSIEDLAIINPF